MKSIGVKSGRITKEKATPRTPVKSKQATVSNKEEDSGAGTPIPIKKEYSLLEKYDLLNNSGDIFDL